ncbi:MAG: hypothetical protein AB7K24_17865 [Gemmataceae bacterium]
MLVYCPGCRHPRIVPERFLGNQLRCDLCRVPFVVQAMRDAAGLAADPSRLRTRVQCQSVPAESPVEARPNASSRRQHRREPWCYAFLSALSWTMGLAAPQLIILWIVVQVSSTPEPPDAREVLALAASGVLGLLAVLAGAALLGLALDVGRSLRQIRRRLRHH